MDNNNKLALIVGYYLSRFDSEGLNSLGFTKFSEAYKKANAVLGVKASSIRNMRDEFDPYFTNDRIGRIKDSVPPSRQKVIDQFSNYDLVQMTDVVQQILEGNHLDKLNHLVENIDKENTYFLKDLNQLSNYLRSRFHQEYKHEEIQLSEEFKAQYGAFLRSNGQNIEFQHASVVITTSGNHKIYAPNQWFAIASYMAELIEELINYKTHLDRIINPLFSNGNAKKEYIKLMKENPPEDKKARLLELCGIYFRSISKDEEEANCCSEYIVKFACDYDWWFGSKTIDRADYFVSPVLNLVNVVNVTQSYIADIAYNYAINPELYELVVLNSNYKAAVDEPKVIAPKDVKKYQRKTGGQNLIVYGAPGTGKSRKLEDMFGCIPPLTRRVVFHSEYTYYEFIGTYKPVPVYKVCSDSMMNLDKSVFLRGEPYIDYRFVPGPFVKVLIDAWLDPTNMYTLLIEEINRANVSAVFGEVFQLLDRNIDGSSEYSYWPSKDIEDYLKSIEGMDEFIHEGIKLPSNMNIVATMNSADQGVNLIDSAFKRRWNYEYIKIDIGNAVHKDYKIKYAGGSIEWGLFVTALNNSLKTHRIDEDRLIGPYFIKPEELTSRAAVDKLLLYLWDDVLRHKREQFFESTIRTFSDLSDCFEEKDVLNVGGFNKNVNTTDLETESAEQSEDENSGESAAVML